MKNIIIAGIISLGLTTSVMAMSFNDNDGLQTTTCKSMPHKSSFSKKRK